MAQWLELTSQGHEMYSRVAQHQIRHLGAQVEWKVSLVIVNGHFKLSQGFL